MWKPHFGIKSLQYYIFQSSSKIFIYTKLKKAVLQTSIENI